MPFDSLPVEIPNKTKQTLQKALTLIEHGWCQGYEAKNKRNIAVSPQSSYAVTFCMIGALTRALGRAPNGNAPEVQTLLSVIAPSHITSWNDSPSRRKEEVINAFKKAILLA